MTEPAAETWRHKRCLPCRGGVARLSLEQAAEHVASLDGWRLDRERHRIQKQYTVKNFLAGIDLFQRVARLAEDEGHHPDLHLEGYRHVRIELSTHAIGGLSENDFILAAKIDALPVQLH